jgi:hypothetical protein
LSFAEPNLALPNHLQGLEEDFAALAENMTSDKLRVAKFQADVEREFSAETFNLETFPTLAFLPKVLWPQKQFYLVTHSYSRRNPEFCCSLFIVVFYIPFPVSSF